MYKVRTTNTLIARITDLVKNFYRQEGCLQRVCLNSVFIKIETSIYYLMINVIII